MKSIKKAKLLAIALTLVCVGTIPVLAYIYFFETEPTEISGGITISPYSTSNISLGIYWDEECTQPVTDIEYGEITQPDNMRTLWKLFYIRNEGDFWLDIYWKSTLRCLTDEITEWWDNNPYWHTWNHDPLNRTRLEPGEIRGTYYGIRISQYASTGRYSWVITVWGEHYY